MPDAAAQLDRLRTALAERYGIERELGRGGMATVYLAHDLRHERRVAVKVLHPELAATIGPERFLREIRLAAQLTTLHLMTDITEQLNSALAGRYTIDREVGAGGRGRRLHLLRHAARRR